MSHGRLLNEPFRSLEKKTTLSQDPERRLGTGKTDPTRPLCLTVQPNRRRKWRQHERFLGPLSPPPSSAFRNVLALGDPAHFLMFIMSRLTEDTACSSLRYVQSAARTLCGVSVWYKLA